MESTAVVVMLLHFPLLCFCLCLLLLLSTPLLAVVAQSSTSSPTAAPLTCVAPQEVMTGTDAPVLAVNFPYPEVVTYSPDESINLYLDSPVSVGEAAPPSQLSFLSDRNDSVGSFLLGVYAQSTTSPTLYTLVAQAPRMTVTVCRST